ncbi:hypothetical protein WME90_35590 [Sorangium sp. So ce375]|uniref:hypothetical protein n=1 Tax=Sorangium sp. So ce375 TaxID=3133306 RepID=UPI003F5B1C63
MPRSARSSLTDFDPDKTGLALRRLYLLGAAALLAAAGTVWLTARRDMSVDAAIARGTPPR